MVNSNKIERKLPGLLIDVSVQSIDNDYQKKRYKVGKLKQRQPTLYNNFLTNFYMMLDELDKAAEDAGFQHVTFEHGRLVTKTKKR